MKETRVTEQLLFRGLGLRSIFSVLLLLSSKSVLLCLPSFHLLLAVFQAPESPSP